MILGFHELENLPRTGSHKLLCKAGNWGSQFTLVAIAGEAAALDKPNQRHRQLLTLLLNPSTVEIETL